MKRPVYYLVVGVLLQTASKCFGLEWEFGSNLSGSKTILEKEGIIPSYAREKRVQINAPKCTDVVYVKVEVDDMPTVTYNIDITLVVIKFEKGRRTKNSEFRVTAKGVKSESANCGAATTPMSPTRYPPGENPYIDGTPYFQFSKEYFPREASDPYDVHPHNAHPTNAHPLDANPNDAHPHDAHSNNEYHPHGAHSNDVDPYNAHPNDVDPYNAQPNDVHPHDAHPNDEHRYDAHPNDEHPHNTNPNDAHQNDAYSDHRNDPEY